MRIFLDTGVLADASVRRGLCADLLAHVLDEHDLVVSELVLHELERRLREEPLIRAEDLENALGLVRRGEVAPDSPVQYAQFTADMRTSLILTAAVDARADVIVSDDEELLGATQGLDISAVSPRQYWEKVRAERDHGP